MPKMIFRFDATFTQKMLKFAILAFWWRKSDLIREIFKTYKNPIMEHHMKL